MPATRNTTLVVGAIALALVALLVWKPWDGPGPQPSPLVAVPTFAPQPTDGPGTLLPASPGTPWATIRPGGAPNPVPTSGPPALPSPDLAPLGQAGEFALASAPANARCLYGRAGNGLRQLEGIEVLPPTVTVANPREQVSDLETMGWRIELQRNRLDTLFDSEWETIARSRRQLVPAINDQPADFRPLTVQLSADLARPSAVYRVLVVAEWYTRNVELAGRGELIASSYIDGPRARQSRPEGCHGVRVSG